MNQVARIHGRHQIKELIDSVALGSIESQLSINSTLEKAPETKEVYPRGLSMERTNSFSKNGYINSLCQPHCQELKGTELQTSFQRTISSVSTLPELNDPLDFFRDFDQITDQTLRHQPNCSGFVINFLIALDL